MAEQKSIFLILNIVFINLIIFIPGFINPINAFNYGLPNNKFGIHFAQPNPDDFQKAGELINSNGGDWGYVTLVMQEDNRDKSKWQETFDRMRELHLIPIIRLATVPQGAIWRKPGVEDAEGWVSFLDSLNWVTRDRYVILFNEPNHGAEWGGISDPSDYAKVALEFAEKLKTKNQDFFIMIAGLDASAPQSPPNYYDEGRFLSEVISNITVEQFNNLFSGLASHSYPNPGFSGSPYDHGRRSVRGYEWELNLLNNLGVKELPVFITETGWKRGDEQSVANYFTAAYENVWLPDNRVRAVTPFIFDYQGEPFINFSWKLPIAKITGDKEFYSQYYSVRSLVKTAGSPEQIESGTLQFDFPGDLVTQSSYRFGIKLKNTGQAVWDKDFGYRLSLEGEQTGNFEYFAGDLKNVKPFSETDAEIFLKTNSGLGKGEAEIVLKKDDKTILSGGIWNFETYPLPDLSIEAKLFPKFSRTAEGFELQIFNDKDEIVLKKNNIGIENGRVLIREVQNVALGKKYRLVLLKPFYLPRQAFIVFQKGINKLEFENLLPLDFYPDGKLDFRDLGRLITQPDKFMLLLP